MKFKIRYENNKQASKRFYIELSLHSYSYSINKISEYIFLRKYIYLKETAYEAAKIKIKNNSKALYSNTWTWLQYVIHEWFIQVVEAACLLVAGTNCRCQMASHPTALVCFYPANLYAAWQSSMSTAWKGNRDMKRPVRQAGGISTPAYDPLGFPYWRTNQRAHWGCSLLLEFQNNIQYALVCVCVWLPMCLCVRLGPMRGSDVHGFSAIRAAISIVVSERIWNPRNHSANPSHIQTDGVPNERGCVSVSPQPARGLTLVTLNNSISLPKRVHTDRSDASGCFSHPKNFAI